MKHVRMQKIIHKIITLNSREVILEKRVKFCLASWVSTLPKFRGTSINTMLRSWFEVAFSSPHRIISHPSWFPNPGGFLKLNFNGSVVGHRGPSGIEGLVRDSTAVCILPYSELTKTCLVQAAKLIALQAHLWGASRLCFHSLIVEGNYSCVIRWASGSSRYPWRLANTGEMNVSFVHVLCNANEATCSLDEEGMRRPALVVDLFTRSLWLFRLLGLLFLLFICVLSFWIVFFVFALQYISLMLVKIFNKISVTISKIK